MPLILSGLSRVRSYPVYFSHILYTSRASITCSHIFARSMVLGGKGNKLKNAHEANFLEGGGGGGGGQQLNITEPPPFSSHL